MSFYAFVGCLLVAFSPVFGLVLLVVLPDARLIVTFLTSSLFWLVSMTVSSIVWIAIPPFRSYHLISVPVAVLSEELARLLLYFFILYVFFVRFVLVFSHRPCLDWHRRLQRFILHPYAHVELDSTIAVGSAFGATKVLVMYVPVFWKGYGPGALFLDSSPPFSFFIVTAWCALLFCALEVALTVIEYFGLRNLKNNFRLTSYFFALLAHFIAAFLSLVYDFGGSFQVMQSLVAFSVVLTCAYAVGVALFDHYSRPRPRPRPRVHSSASDVDGSDGEIN